MERVGSVLAAAIGSRLERAGVISKSVASPNAEANISPRLNPAIVVLVEEGRTRERFLFMPEILEGDMMALWRVLWRLERHLKSVGCAR